MPTPNPFSNAEAAAIQALVTPIDNALAAVEANPTPLNVAAQFAAIQGNLIAALPVIEQVGISGAAAFLRQELAAAVASITPTPSPAPAPTPAPAS